MTPFDPGIFTVKTPKPLLVLLLLDVSSSMSGDMDTLNAAVRDMLESFAEEEQMETLIKVAVITFSSNAQVLHEFTDASILKQNWHDLSAGGTTNLAEALRMAKEMMEDKTRTPSRAYRPTVILISDGEPYPDNGWKVAMQDFVNNGRSSKCDRMSMAIGSWADEDMLKSFLINTEHELQYAHDAAGIKKFFRFVTMSTLMRTRSQNPNIIPSLVSIDTDDD